MLPSAADVVHVVSNFADVVYGLVIWSVAAIGESDLEILPIKTAGCGLIRKLMPMGAYEIRMFES